MRIAFYKNTKRPGIAGLFDALIRKVTGGPYSHCELIFSDDLAFSASIQDGGTRFKQIAFEPAKWDFIELTGINETRARSFCLRNAKRGYDFPGVFRFLIAGIPHSKKRWFCSEICCAALQEGGILWGINPWQVHPSALHGYLNAR